MVHTITLGTWAGNMWMSRTLSLQTRLSLSRGVGTGVNTWDICSSRTDGTLQAPVLVLSTSRAQEGEVVLAHCFLRKIIPATRIVFCKDGMELYNMKAQEDVVIYSMPLNISARSSGTYTCAYQQRNESNWLRRSPLSTPLDLHVTGHVSNSTAGTITADTNTPLNLTVIHVVSVTVTLLLSAATFWTIRKGACRERCRRKGLPWCWRRKDFLMVTLLIARGCLEDEGLLWGWTECSA
ncbi:uncharacterized protein LOC121112275 isoform X2 [Gallus gallus]|uniref:uncharacterized protein LOC121112275 isoform X2 n=1 Tax=Gallus gallus TaxID=9031 RepID=UPI001F01798B|nr:uncharacterized protein LOC121112275 isoform X2 [Gallus gallus]